MTEGGQNDPGYPEKNITEPIRRLSLENLEGEIISGNYEIKRRIGKGGMGVVYLAKQTKLGRDVCLKVLNPDLLENDDAIGRFHREARGLSSLHHPNIVTIFDYGCDGNLNYIVMEYANGVTLNKLIKKNGPMTLDTFLPIAVQILKGIGEAHKIGLIHRDIKPANIIICNLEGEQNFVKILDFGLAKLAKGDDDVTKEHQLVGSASYMAPEQILTGVSDTRTDVYALGIMFYLMLSGVKPFTGPNDNVVLFKHVNEQAAPLKSMLPPGSDIPDTLCTVIDQCLIKDPAKRPADALDLLNAISCALDAPQLCAGFSSMSLARVELQKCQEDNSAQQRPAGEMNDIMTMSGVVQALNSMPVPPQAMPVNSSPSMPAVQRIQPASQLSVGEVSSVSGTSNVSGASYRPSMQLSAAALESVMPKSSMDRKLVVAIVIIAIIIISAATTTLVIAMSESAPQAKPTAQVTENELAGLLSAVEKSIAENKWQEAETFLKSAMTRPEAQTEDAVRDIIDYQKKIDAGREIEKADKLRIAGNYPEARDQYHAVLQKYPDNKKAVDGLAIIERYYAEQSRIAFSYDGNMAELDLYIDDEYQGNPGEETIVGPGLHTLTVKREGYKDWVEKIELKKADRISITIELEKNSKPKPAPPRRNTRKPRPEKDDGGGLLLAPSSKSRSGKNTGLLGI